MRKLLTYAIPVILGVGVLAALVSNPSEEGTFSASRQEGGLTEEPFGLPAVIEEPTTTTTTAPPAPQPTTPATVAPTPTTAARPVSTRPPAPKPAATPRPAPQPVPGPGPPPPDCGTGGASAQAKVVNVGANRYRIVVTVSSTASKTLELDSLTVRAEYNGGVSKTFSPAVAGRTIEPGATISIDIPESDGESPKTLHQPEFAFHTAGLPQCSSQ